MGPSEQLYRKWHSLVPEMGQNESRPVPVMADCQFGDYMKWKIFRNGPPKRTLLEMGTITGNGSTISSTGKLHVLGLTASPNVDEAIEDKMIGKKAMLQATRVIHACRKETLFFFANKLDKVLVQITLVV
jgi:hypothetical protein